MSRGQLCLDNKYPAVLEAVVATSFVGQHGSLTEVLALQSLKDFDEL